MDSAKSEAAAPSAESDEVAVGTVIAGKYRLDARLGSGGMGTVWSCTHVSLGERMAVKIVSTSTARSQEIRARFAREARASAKLKSRFTVRVFDSGELPYGTPYIVMEYLEGETLSQHLRRVGRLPIADTVHILSQVARGLELAHEAGLVHRDIKPDNIFLAHTPDDGVVAKVFDFGVVKLLENAEAANSTETIAGTFVGTPQFMSPEQAMGQADVDHRADIYSLGVLAHRMLTGRGLFDAASIPALLLQICNGPLPNLRDALPELAPEVDAWFQRACARDRDVRFASAIDCIEALIVAARMSGSAMAFSDSTPSLSLRHARSGAWRLSGLTPSTPLPRLISLGDPSPIAAPASISAVVGARSGIESPRRPALRRIVAAAAVSAVLIVAAVVFVWRMRSDGDAAIGGSASPSATKDTSAAREPSAATSAVPIASATPPLDSGPSAVGAAPSTTAASHSSVYSVAQPARAVSPVSPKRPNPAPTTTASSPGARASGSAITDVGY
jgi:serine/threonine-protein kinase